MAGENKWTATTSDSVLVAADPPRKAVTVHNHSKSSETVFIRLNHVAAVDGGLELPPGKAITFRGQQAQYEIHGITAGGSASGGYEEMK